MAVTTTERIGFREDWHWLAERFRSEVEINRLSLNILNIDHNASPPRITAESNSHVYVFKVLNKIEFPDQSEGETLKLFVHRIQAPLVLYSFTKTLVLLGGTFVKQDPKNESKAMSNSFELWLISKKSKLPVRERIRNIFSRKTRE